MVAVNTTSYRPLPPRARIIATNRLQFLQGTQPKACGWARPTTDKIWRGPLHTRVTPTNTPPTQPRLTSSKPAIYTASRPKRSGLLSMRQAWPLPSKTARGCKPLGGPWVRMDGHKGEETRRSFPPPPPPPRADQLNDQPPADTKEDHSPAWHTSHHQK